MSTPRWSIKNALARCRAARTATASAALRHGRDETTAFLLRKAVRELTRTEATLLQALRLARRAKTARAA